MGNSAGSQAALPARKVSRRPRSTLKQRCSQRGRSSPAAHRSPPSRTQRPGAAPRALASRRMAGKHLLQRLPAVGRPQPGARPNSPAQRPAASACPRRRALQVEHERWSRRGGRAPGRRAGLQISAGRSRSSSQVGGTEADVGHQARIRRVASPGVAAMRSSSLSTCSRAGDGLRGVVEQLKDAVRSSGASGAKRPGRQLGLQRRGRAD